MIVYGSRIYGRKNLVKGWGNCVHCGEYVKLINYTGRKWGHLYFIPLIPDGPRICVIKQCKKCSHYLFYPEKDVATIINDRHRDLEVAISALIDGKETFEKDGVAISAAEYLVDSTEILLCLNNNEILRMTLTTLQEKGLKQVYHMVTGQTHEFEGNLNEAEKNYRIAAKCNPDNIYPLALLGSVYMKRKDYRSAEKCYEKTLHLSGNKYPILQILLTIYENLKDYSKLATTYEQCFKLVPELVEDKKVFKAYKKACKKTEKKHKQYE